MGYSVLNYGNMINDTWRMDAYVKAVRKVVKPGAVVMDLGAGTGFFSFLACELGAKKVYSIEPNPAINVGINTAVNKGLSNKIEFINELSTKVKIPEKADLIISDLRGNLPLLGKNISTIIDARKRFLKKDGILIPKADDIWVAIVQTPGVYNNIVKVWDRNKYKINQPEAKK